MTEQDIARVLAALRVNPNIAAVADETGFKYGAVHALATGRRRASPRVVPARARALDEAHVAWARKAMKVASAKWVAAKLGVGESTLWKAIKTRSQAPEAPSLSSRSKNGTARPGARA